MATRSFDLSMPKPSDMAPAPIQAVAGLIMLNVGILRDARLFMYTTKVDLDPRDEPIDRSYQQADFSLQWGLAGGLMVRTSPNLLVEARRTSS